PRREQLPGPGLRRGAQPAAAPVRRLTERLHGRGIADRHRHGLGHGYEHDESAVPDPPGEAEEDEGEARQDDDPPQAAGPGVLAVSSVRPIIALSSLLVGALHLLAGTAWAAPSDVSAALVRDINPGISASSSPSQIINVDGTLFFTADDGANGMELWKS